MRSGVRRGTGAVTLLAALASFAGCGSSGSGNANPATVTPASAPLYATIAIKPSGGAKSDAEVAAKKLTHLAEPYGGLAQALLSSGGAQLQFKRDIEPWVGDEAGVFITSLNASTLPQGASSVQGLLEGGLTGAVSSAIGAAGFGKGAQGGIVFATSDVGGARSFLQRTAHEHGAQSTSYRGVSYEISADGVAEGIVKNFAVIASQSGMKSVIDTSLGGASITTAPGYVTPPKDAIASAYARPQELTKAIAGSTGPASQGVALLGQLFKDAQWASLSVTPTSNSISLQGEVGSTSATKPLFGKEGAQALGALPGTSWLAAGVGDTGSNLPSALRLLSAVASLGSSTVFSSFGGPSIERIFKALESPGAKLSQDFGSWAGAGGMFIGGSGLFNLQAGLVIDSKEPAASQAAVAKLGALMKSAGATVASAQIAGADAAISVKLQGFPAVIYVADGAGKFVLGLGQQSIQGALTPSSTLSTSPAYSSASAILGGGIEPSLIVEFPTLLGFLEGVGLTQSEPLAKIIPYLKSLGTLTAGATSQSGVERFRVVLGLA
ncbi:MAG TPA: DUF3352 domain-containing protein [Solirubrobacteraceae bacterium]|jgi:hypothetical protein